MKAEIVKVMILTIIMCFSASVSAVPVNWNAIEVNDVEYYVQTDKSIYHLGEDVEILYRITNLGQESITYTAGSDPIWNFWAEADGQNIWTGMHSKFAVVTSLTLESGESIEFPGYSPFFTWNMHDDAGYSVQAGEYDIIGGVDSANYYDYTKVSVPIVINPEPATLALLSMGLLIARSRSRYLQQK